VVYCVCTVIHLPSVSSARASNVMLSWLWECTDSGGGGGGGNSHHERKRQERASEREETRDCLSIVSRCGGERVGSASLTWAAAGCSCIARWCSSTCPCPAADRPADRPCVLQPESQAPSMARHSNVSASTGLLDLDLDLDLDLARRVLDGSATCRGTLAPAVSVSLSLHLYLYLS